MAANWKDARDLLSEDARKMISAFFIEDSLSVKGASALIDAMLHDVAEVNKANGWHDEARSFGEDIALLHSELSEALEGYRKQDMENVKEELVDVFIRLCDTLYRQGVSGEEFVRIFGAKLAKNAERGYRHGGKAL